jgi:uncharacterized protein (DUF983 family)
MSNSQNRTAATGFMRGVARRCPNCGEGSLFSGYLKVAPACAACGHDTGAYRADDGPAYFTMLIVGHLLVAPMLAFGFILTWPIGVVLALCLSFVALATLTLLPIVKGGFIGVQWGTRTGVAPSNSGAIGRDGGSRTHTS